MEYERVKDMKLIDQIERLRFEKAKLIAQKIRTNDRITLTNTRIGYLVEELEYEEKAVKKVPHTSGQEQIKIRATGENR